MKKILVVDNHPVMLKFMTNLLEKEGHEVLTAQDGLSALDVLKKHIPDVMFVDLVMPNISGVGLISISRKLYHKMRIIAITGWGDHPGALASEAAADIVLYKPVDLFKVEELLTELLTDIKTAK